MLVVGGGVIGLAIAWRCAQRGLIGVDRGRPGAAAPAPRQHRRRHARPGHRAALRRPRPARAQPRVGRALSRRSSPNSPTRPASTSASGAAARCRSRGTPPISPTCARCTRSRRVARRHVRAAHQPRAARRLEPALAAGLPGGLLGRGRPPGRQPAAARGAARARRASVGVDVRSGPSGPDRRDRRPGDPASRWPTASGLTGGHTVLAAGAWSRGIDGLPDDVRRRCGRSRVRRCACAAAPDLLDPRRPRFGQGQPRLRRAARRRRTRDRRVQRGGRVRRTARAPVPSTNCCATRQTLVPELSEVEFAEVSTSLRPGSPDNAPMIGPTAARRARHRDRPLPQRHPAHAGHRRRGRRA